MKKTIIIIAIVIIVAIGAYYFFSGNSSSQAPINPPQTNTSPALNNPSINTPSPTVPVSSAPANPASSNITVSIKNFSFNPSAVTIKAGTKVTWVNNDSAPHTITSDSGNLLNSGTLSPGQSFSFTFTNIGAANYHCSIHPAMKGGVIVAQ